jgi:anthranilate 1,2-dioxygenase small subunit
MKVERAQSGITPNDALIQELVLWYELQKLQEEYISAIDTDRLEEWATFFTEDGLYEIIPKENEDGGFPVGIMHCFGRPMMRDRILSLRKANVFEEHTYRHMTSGFSFKKTGPDSAEMQSNYLVIQTLTDGESRVYQAGRYFDVVVRTEDGWRYKSKRAVFDTLRVQTLLVTPV